jgi:hypothetical protein
LEDGEHVLLEADRVHVFYVFFGAGNCKQEKAKQEKAQS